VFLQESISHVELWMFFNFLLNFHFFFNFYISDKKNVVKKTCNKTMTTAPTMADENNPLKPISHECAFLETYFYSIAQFQFDRAHEFTEKERASHDTNKPLWNGLIASLLTFASVEKSYFAMAFIQKGIFNRTLKPIYLGLSNELNSLILSALNPHNTEALALELCKQINQFAQARLKMIDFYEYFVKCKWGHVFNTKEIMEAIREIGKMFAKAFHHPVLDPLKTSFNFETEILSSLLNTELKLGEWEFLETLLTLRECQSKLHAWRLLSPSLYLQIILYSLLEETTNRHARPLPMAATFSSSPVV